MTDAIPARLGNLFIARKDVKAVQQSDGSYAPERTKFTIDDLRAHVAGERTLGHYLLSASGTTKVIAFDIDLVKGPCQWDDEEIMPRAAWLAGHAAKPDMTRAMSLLALGLAVRLHRTVPGLPIAIAYSGNKGVHVYGLPNEHMPAKVAVAAGRQVMAKLGWENSRGKNFWQSTAWSMLEVETFPKQESLEGKDLGNLMRLPLGFNRKTGHRSYFLKLVPPTTAFHELDPMAAMSGDEVPYAVL